MKPRKASYITSTRPVSKSDDLSVVILGANPIKRTSSHGTHYLLQSSSKYNVIEEQSLQIRNAFPNAEINMVIGFEAERLIKKRVPGIRLIENPNYENTNEIEQLRLILNNITNHKLLIINNDAIFNYETFAGLDKETSTTLYYTPEKSTSEDIGVRNMEGYASVFSFYVETKWAGITLLEGPELDILTQFCYNTSNRRLFLWEGLNHLITKRSLKVREITKGKFGKIKSAEDTNKI
jgi:CTP:phosphocholine cytidylyltransferase-like protein